jgi:hypothetical protein
MAFGVAKQVISRGTPLYPDSWAEEEVSVRGGNVMTLDQHKEIMTVVPNTQCLCTPTRSIEDTQPTWSTAVYTIVMSRIHT